MAKLTHPLHSQTASGTIGKRITFQTNQYGAYARPYKATTAPNTDAQQLTKARIAVIGAGWRAATTTDRETWHARATAAGTHAYAEYTQENFARLAAGLPITPIWPPAPPPQPTTLALWAADDDGADLVLTFALTETQPDARVLIYRHPTLGFTPTDSDLWQTVTVNDTAQHSLRDTHAAPARYAYAARVVTAYGTDTTTNQQLYHIWLTDPPTLTNWSVATDAMTATLTYSLSSIEFTPTLTIYRREPLPGGGTTLLLWRTITPADTAEHTLTDTVTTAGTYAYTAYTTNSDGAQFDEPTTLTADLAIPITTLTTWSNSTTAATTTISYALSSAAHAPTLTIHRSTQQGFTPGSGTIWQTINPNDTATHTVTDTANADTTYYYAALLTNNAGGTWTAPAQLTAHLVPTWTTMSAWSVTTAGNVATITYAVSSTTNAPSVLIYRSTQNGFTPGAGNLWRTLTPGDTAAHTTQDTTTVPAHYYYRAATTNSTAATWSHPTQLDATLTSAPTTTTQWAETNNTMNADKEALAYTVTTTINSPSAKIYKSMTHGFTPSAGNLVTTIAIPSTASQRYNTAEYIISGYYWRIAIVNSDGVTYLNPTELGGL